jgi:hypothetical protein
MEVRYLGTDRADQMAENLAILIAFLFFRERQLSAKVIVSDAHFLTARSGIPPHR